MKNRIATAVAVMALAVSGCSHPGSEDHAFQWSEELPAGATVHFRDGAGDITVRRAAGQTALVTGSRRWHHGRARDIRFVVTRVDNDYYVCAMWRASGKCGARGYRGRQTTSFLSMFSLFHRTSDAAADLVAEMPANVAIDATTAIGSVQIDGMTAGVTARTSSGAVEASNVSGPVSLTTTTGDVRLVTDSLAASDDVHLSTARGQIRAELPQNVEGAFDLSVVNGSVSTDLSLPAAPRARAGRHLQGQIGSSTRVVKMRAINGVVTVLTHAPSATAH